MKSLRETKEYAKELVEIYTLSGNPFLCKVALLQALVQEREIELKQINDRIKKLQVQSPLSSDEKKEYIEKNANKTQLEEWLKQAHDTDRGFFKKLKSFNVLRNSVQNAAFNLHNLDEQVSFYLQENKELTDTPATRNQVKQELEKELNTHLMAFHNELPILETALDKMIDAIPIKHMEGEVQKNHDKTILNQHFLNREGRHLWSGDSLLTIEDRAECILMRLKFANEEKQKVYLDIEQALKEYRVLNQHFDPNQEDALKDKQDWLAYQCYLGFKTLAKKPIATEDILRDAEKFYKTSVRKQLGIKIEYLKILPILENNLNETIKLAEALRPLASRILKNAKQLQQDFEEMEETLIESLIDVNKKNLSLKEKKDLENQLLTAATLQFQNIAKVGETLLHKNTKTLLITQADIRDIQDKMVNHLYEEHDAASDLNTSIFQKTLDSLQDAIDELSPTEPLTSSQLNILNEKIIVAEEAHNDFLENRLDIQEEKKPIVSDEKYSPSEDKRSNEFKEKNHRQQERIEFREFLATNQSLNLPESVTNIYKTLQLFANQNLPNPTKILIEQHLQHLDHAITAYNNAAEDVSQKTLSVRSLFGAVSDWIVRTFTYRVQGITQHLPGEQYRLTPLIKSLGGKNRHLLYFSNQIDSQQGDPLRNEKRRIKAASLAAHQFMRVHFHHWVNPAIKSQWKELITTQPAPTTSRWETFKLLTRVSGFGTAMKYAFGFYPYQPIAPTNALKTISNTEKKSGHAAPIELATMRSSIKAEAKGTLSATTASAPSQPISSTATMINKVVISAPPVSEITPNPVKEAIDAMENLKNEPLTSASHYQKALDLLVLANQKLNAVKENPTFLTDFQLYQPALKNCLQALIDNYKKLSQQQISLRVLQEAIDYIPSILLPVKAKRDLQNLLALQTMNIGTMQPSLSHSSLSSSSFSQNLILAAEPMIRNLESMLNKIDEDEAKQNLSATETTLSRLQQELKQLNAIRDRSEKTADSHPALQNLNQRILRLEDRITTKMHSLKQGFKLN